MTFRNKMLLSAVLAVPLTLVAPASGQYQVNNGDVLDASNRVGSGGQNEVGRWRSRVSQEDIVYGNVTAGREFRGGIVTFDPREFRGGTSGQEIDAFVRNTAGVPARGAPRADLSTPQTFYGDSRGVAPPAGAIQNGFAGGAIMPSDALRTPNPYEMTGRNMAAGPLGTTLLLPGTSNAATNRQTMFAGSPLAGVREIDRNQWTQDLASDFARRHPDAQRWTPQMVEQFRQELLDVAGQTEHVAPGARPAGADTVRNDPLAPFEAPANDRLRSDLGTDQLRGTALTGSVQGREGPRLPSAAQQSAQYAELQRRLQRFQTPGQGETDRQAAQAQRRAGEQAGQPRQPGETQARPGQQPTPQLPRVAPQRPEQATQPPQVQIPRDLPTPRPDEQPLQIKSLADGVQAEGLASILRQAEENMRGGKFLSAVQSYDRAQQVAPNNPLIQLGRAHAMLGGSYFARADQALRQAIAGDPALLMAQYDLRSMIGEKRLATMVDDLKTIANTEKNSVQPVFLLAYVAYNTGDEAMAAQWLNEASRRANDRDAIVNLMKQYWHLPRSANGDQAPTPGSPQDLNK